MKMEGVVETVNGRVNDVSRQPSPRDIGREFVRQYYTMLSEKPEEVFRFYSHESFFVHDQEPPVQGQQKIQKAIGRLGFEECKARIYTVNGTATMNNGLVIQVCGELSLGGSPGRRFIQTFILCPQTPKKYYVHNDVFQWLDHAFGDTLTPSQPKSEIQADSPSSEEESTNGEIASLNGHVHPVTGSDLSVEPRSVESSVGSITGKSEEPASTVTSTISASAEEDGADIRQDESSEETVEERTEETSVIEATAPAEEPHHAVVGDAAPKTWAKLVGAQKVAPPGTVIQLASANTVVPPQADAHMTQSNVAAAVPTQSTNNSGMQQISQARDDGCRLYVGGITRNLVPESAAEVERELRAQFEKFGPVTAVNVPRRIFDNADTQRTLYAFVVMKTLEGARNAFSATRKERSLSLLPLTIRSLGFSGEATLSEQKGNQMNTRPPYNHRGPPLQGSMRGGYGMRGGGGMSRPGPRGMHPRHYNSGNDHRQFTDYSRR